MMRKDDEHRYLPGKAQADGERRKSSSCLSGQSEVGRWKVDEILHLVECV